VALSSGRVFRPLRNSATAAPATEHSQVLKMLDFKSFIFRTYKSCNPPLKTRGLKSFRIRIYPKKSSPLLSIPCALFRRNTRGGGQSVSVIERQKWDSFQ